MPIEAALLGEAFSLERRGFMHHPPAPLTLLPAAVTPLPALPSSRCSHARDAERGYGAPHLTHADDRRGVLSVVVRNARNYP